MSGSGKQMSEPIIRAESIVKEYHLGRTRLPVLRGVDAVVERGAFVAIVGASGSGKSTMLHILGALDIPQKGQVWFQGRPLFEPEDARTLPHGLGDDDLPPRRAASLEGRRNTMRNAATGFVFQFYHLLPEFDVVENVMMPAIVGKGVARWSAERAAAEKRARDLLEQVEMTHRLHHRPNELSGGERQRVAIARALMNQPEVLFADEPTGNLDTRTGREILGRLRQLHADGQTIVMVTHDLEIAAMADKTIRLVDGRAV